MDELLVLFGYPAASGADLIAGTLPLWYYFESFARRIPTWRLPVRGSIASFLASGRLVRGGPNALSAALGGAGVCLAGGSVGNVKRVRLYRKTSTPCWTGYFGGPGSSQGFGRDSGSPQGSDSGLPGAKFLRVHQEAGGHDPRFARVGIG